VCPDCRSAASLRQQELEAARLRGASRGGILDRAFLSRLNPTGRAMYFVGQVGLLAMLVAVLLGGMRLEADELIMPLLIGALVIIVVWGVVCVGIWPHRQQGLGDLEELQLLKPVRSPLYLKVRRYCIAAVAVTGLCVGAYYGLRAFGVLDSTVTLEFSEKEKDLHDAEVDVEAGRGGPRCRRLPCTVAMKPGEQVIYVRARDRMHVVFVDVGVREKYTLTITLHSRQSAGYATKDYNR